MRMHGSDANTNHYEMRAVEESERLTLLQISRPARGCLSYLLASGGEALASAPSLQEKCQG